MKWLREKIGNERGGTAVLAAMVLLVLVALSGLVVDCGWIVYTQIRLDEATNKATSGCINAVDEAYYQSTGILTYDPVLLDTELRYFLALNYPEAQLVKFEIDPDQPNMVYVTTKVKTEVHFSKILGIDEVTVKSEIISKLSPVSG